jgi:hypothetical protein
VDAEKFKINRRAEYYSYRRPIYRRPSVDAAALAEELFCSSPATTTQSVKYDTAINIDIEKTTIGILSMS